MPDFLYINILTEGMIPWIQEVGPKFGYYTSFGMYDLLARDPRVTVEIATAENIAKRKVEYLEKVKARVAPKNISKSEMKESLSINDSVVVTVEEKPETITEENSNEEEIEEHDELDEILDGISTNLEMQTIIPQAEELKEFKIYKNKDLNGMTKKQLKQILLDRGYTKGPYAPKYHDHVEDLVEKVKKTQKI